MLGICTVCYFFGPISIARYRQKSIPVSLDVKEKNAMHAREFANKKRKKRKEKSPAIMRGDQTTPMPRMQENKTEKKV
jgi:hypothetical protein